MTAARSAPAAVARRLAGEGRGTPVGTAWLPATADREAVGVPLAGHGYREAEWLVGGSVPAWRRGPDGEPAPGALLPFTTRVLVRVPEPRRFNGSVHLEPLHPDLDSAPTWQVAHPWLLREGAAWVGVTQDRASARLLRGVDPERYAAVGIPDDGQRWEIVAAVAAALRSAAPDLLDGLPVARCFLSGWSMTGSFCRVFLQEGFHRRLRSPGGGPVIDGYLIGISSGGAGRAGYPPLSAGDPPPPPDDPRRTIGAHDVPVVEVLSELESETHFAQRRPDADAADDRYRLYQVAGTSHDSLGPARTTNRHQFLAAGLEVGSCEIVEQPGDGRLDLIARAAYRALEDWVRLGRIPPRAERFRPAARVPAPPGGPTELLRDGDGNAVGGVRTPWVVAPLATYRPHSTPRPGRCRPGPLAPMLAPEDVAALHGHREAHPAAAVLARYGTREAYLAAFRAGCDDLVARGLLLPADLPELLDLAQRQPWPAPSLEGQEAR